MKLSECISPAFYEAHRMIRAGEMDEIILIGGRGSCKSSFAAIEVIWLMIRHPRCHAVVLRKVQDTLRTSVYAQIRWATRTLGMESQFEYRVSPMQIVYRPTGQTVFFFGLDDAGKLKSLKTADGYAGIVWFEELDQYAGEEEIRSAEQSILRGGAFSFIIKSFNPPASPRNWVNVYAGRARERCFVHRSTYLQTPRPWLGEHFFAQAEQIKAANSTVYRHEYLGEAVGGGTAVFENIQARGMPQEEIERFDRVYRGVDWGYYPDPFAYNECHYDAARRTLYIFGEITAYREGNEQTARRIAARGRKETITADSAEPKSIADYKAYGLPCVGAKKGPGSVEHGMRFLQALQAIVIDPERCPDTYREMSAYEYAKDGNGEAREGYPDAENHHIDAIRYALEAVSTRRVAKAYSRG